MFNRIVSVLTDEELSLLSIATYDEENNRIVKKLVNNEFPKLEQDELLLIESGLRIESIKLYRARTDLSLRVSKMVVDKAYDEMVNQGFRKQNPV